MTRMTGPDCAVICKLLSAQTHPPTHAQRERERERERERIIHPPLGGSMRVAYNDKDERVGLRGYVHFNKYHT